MFFPLFSSIAYFLKPNFYCFISYVLNFLLIFSLFLILLQPTPREHRLWFLYFVFIYFRACREEDPEKQANSNKFKLIFQFLFSLHMVVIISLIHIKRCNLLNVLQCSVLKWRFRYGQPWVTEWQDDRGWKTAVAAMTQSNWNFILHSQQVIKLNCYSTSPFSFFFFLLFLFLSNSVCIIVADLFYRELLSNINFCCKTTFVGG
jgi:hypothetical protein